MKTLSGDFDEFLEGAGPHIKNEKLLMVLKDAYFAGALSATTLVVEGGEAAIPAIMREAFDYLNKD